ncbi:hypothetical protein AMAG_07818 [Allomyces macrogynus ATCC 38327]|uniref:AMMECR1 domain-containing protein n=1 Tax=Allomyces macrogynus (strain ATCC 38327) TaxID=578462 RepID=A0A0L0SJD8_ALLM3|nr:hypothetical protein AMAG_07818 [Allomyces macrogynus ATCC 38327]|eukprot:KNE62616.1 hypothetical protein AMAG_07818 [Allomyces macrogynus ATCC 38327]
MVATKEHCYYCFDTLVTHLEANGNGSPTRAMAYPLPGAIAPSFDDDEYPLFVTWDKLGRGRVARLRGCIGNFSPMRLHSGLREYALISALQDRRFAPISLTELDQLQCGVSLLLAFEDAEDYLDWDVGVHGVRIAFDDPRTRTRRSATYLPEVALAQEWDHVAAIDSLVRKAGYQGPIDDDLRESLAVTRYQSSKAKATYAEYAAWRREVKTRGVKVEDGEDADAEDVRG